MNNNVGKKGKGSDRSGKRAEGRREEAVRDDETRDREKPTPAGAGSFLVILPAVFAAHLPGSHAGLLISGGLQLGKQSGRLSCLRFWLLRLGMVVLLGHLSLEPLRRILETNGSGELDKLSTIDQSNQRA